MKQAQRVPMEDGAEKRRKYLQTIVGARTLGCIGWTLIVGFVLPTMLLAAGAVVSIIVGSRYRSIHFLPCSYAFPRRNGLSGRPRD